MIDNILFLNRIYTPAIPKEPFFFNKFMFMNTIFFLATYLNRIFKNQNFSTFTVIKIDFFLNLRKG